jgi:hypothetical protein
MKDTEINKIMDQKIFEYLELDKNNLKDVNFFKSVFEYTDAIIFGGFLRDILINQEPKDMDILVPPRGFATIKNILQEARYQIIHPDSDSEEYKDLELRVFQPLTAIKGKHKIQVLKPRFNKYINTPQKMIRELFNFVSEVDLSCCGVCWSWKSGFEEMIPCALEHCRHKIFKVFPEHSFYTKRTEGRIKKLEGRGWLNISK